MTKILFITSTHLGDGVLSTGALDHFIRQYPHADITVACGPVTAGIFEKAPRVTRVLAMKKEPYGRHWRRLAEATLWQKWDIVVDLRNSPFSRLLLAKKKYIWSKSDPRRHKVEQIADAIGASPAPVPRLWFDEATLAEAARLAPDGGPILALGPTANWRGKEWPAESYIELVRRLTAADGILPSARVAVLAAAREEKQAHEVLATIPPERQIDVIAKGPPLLGAAVLRRAAFFVGNDSGPMHMAAAVGIPTLGLFGYGWPDLYRPWGAHGAYIRTRETPEALIAPFGGDPTKVKVSLLTSLSVNAVHDAAVALWKQL